MPAPLIDYLGLIMSPTTTPAIGDLPMRGASGGWTTLPVAGASPGSQLQIGTNGIPAWSSATVGVVTALPTPDVTYRGKIITLSGQGLHKDTEWVCQENADGSFQWNRMPVKLLFTINSSTQVNAISHKLNAPYPLVQVVNTTSKEIEFPTVTFTDADTVTVDFGTGTPTGVTYNVTVIG